MSLRLFFCLASGLGLLHTATAQGGVCTFSITGQVVDEHDASSLGYATIYVVEEDRGVVTDSLGYFEIPDFCAGTYTLRISHVGCETREEVVRVRSDVRVIFHLEHHPELLETIELEARRVREVSSASRAEVDQQQLARTSGRPLGDILSTLPGVSAVQTGPTVFKPVIHGLHSHRLLILKDGLRLESQQWGLDHAPEVDPGTAQSISVVKGAAAVQYGSDAVAGVILIDSEDLPSERLMQGHLRLSGVSNGRQGAGAIALTRGFGRGLGMRVQGSFRRAGDARAADYLLTNTGVREGDIRVSLGHTRGLRKLRVSYELFSTELGILRSAHIGNLTDLEEALGRDRPLIIEEFGYRIENPRQRAVHHTAQVGGQLFVEHLGILRGEYAIQWNNRREFDLRRGGRGDIPALDLELITHTGLFSLAHEPIGPLRGKIGLHWSYQLNENVPGTGVRPLIPDYQRYVPAISLVEKWALTSWELEAGARYEFVRFIVKRFDAQNVLRKPEFTFHNFSASAGLRFAPSDHLDLTSHLGFTRRAPHVHELFSEGLHHGAAAIEEGDSNLVPESSVKWVTGLRWQRGIFGAETSVHWQHIRDFIYLRPTGEPRLTIRGAFPVFAYTQHDARLYGGELTTWLDISDHWRWQSAAALLRARNQTEEEALFGMPSDQMRHGLKWTSDKGTSAEVTYTYVWKQTRVPPGGDYAEPPSGYGLVQAEVFVPFKEDKLDLIFSVRNLLNVSYREYLNRLRYYADDTGRSIECRLSYRFL